MPLFSTQRAAAIARKEVYHIWRDPFTLALALALPVFMVVMYGLAIEFNVKDIALAVSDSDQTSSSRQFLDTITSSKYFHAQLLQSPAEAMSDVTAERARATLIIPPHFQSDLMAGRGATVQLLLDGSDNSTVGPVLSYIGTMQRMAAERLTGSKLEVPIDLRTRFLFNSELNSRWFVIPGLTVVVMAILSILLTALTVAREWENGSMELLLSTPVTPLEIIVGKLFPYGVLGVAAVTFVYLIARTVFDVPFVGNLAVFALGCLVFLIAYLAQGLLISVVARKQVVAMQMAMMTGMLPSTLLSGFIFPINSMPPFFRYLTMILPARWFMRIARDTFLKGSSILDLWVPFAALALISLFLIRRATQKFQRDLEG